MDKRGDYSDISIYMCNLFKFRTLQMMAVAGLCLGFSVAFAGTKNKKVSARRPAEKKIEASPVVTAPSMDQKSADLRAFNATLWIDQIKAPISTGQVLFIDSIFAVFKPKKSLNMNDVHTNVLLQIHEQHSAQGSRATIVDYDLLSGWMLVELKKQEIVAPKQKMADHEIVALALRLKLIESTEQGLLFAAIKKFEQNTHQRGLAGEKSFPEMLEIQMKNYGDKLTQTLLKSQRKVSWNPKTNMPLPFVDTCERDLALQKDLREKTSIKGNYYLKCYSLLPEERTPASHIRPSYEVFTGVVETDEPYLKIQKAAGEIDFIHEHILAVHPDLIQNPPNCMTNWISDRNVFVKSCVERNELFKGLYNGVHTFGFYHDKKIIYKTISLQAFSDSNQKEIVKKFLSEMKGNVL